MNHTKEPWDYEINGFSRAILLGDKLTSIGYISNIVNTERIVACVNACADVEDKKLKLGYVKELEAENAELRKVLLQNGYNAKLRW